MKKYNSFINENNNSPHDVNIDELSVKMRKYATKLWFDKLDSIFLNKVIKFRGSKWGERSVHWQDFVITVKKVDSIHSTLYGEEFTIIDIDNNYYTALATMPIRIYDSMNDYNLEKNSKKYNL